MAKPNVYEKAPFLAFPGGCVTNQGYLERNTGWRRAGSIHLSRYAFPDALNSAGLLHGVWKPATEATITAEVLLLGII
ncbi:hypothetical protein CapIbe_007765 [Capra ibex]